MFTCMYGHVHVWSRVFFFVFFFFLQYSTYPVAETVQRKASTASIEGQPQQAAVVVKTGNSADLRSRLQHYQRHQSNEVG